MSSIFCLKVRSPSCPGIKVKLIFKTWKEISANLSYFRGLQLTVYIL